MINPLPHRTNQVDIFKTRNTEKFDREVGMSREMDSGKAGFSLYTHTSQQISSSLFLGT